MTVMTPLEKLWHRIELIAQAAGVPKDTYHQWKHRGYVPPSRHHELVTKAASMPVALTHEELHTLWKTNNDH